MVVTIIKTELEHFSLLLLLPHHVGCLSRRLVVAVGQVNMSTKGLRSGPGTSKIAGPTSQGS